MSIEKQNPATLGENREAMQTHHLEIWKVRKGSSFPLLHCADYLREKPKWKLILTDDSGTVKSEKTVSTKMIQSVKRPIGKKCAMKEKEKQELFTSIANNVLDKFFDGRENKKAKVAARGDNYQRKAPVSCQSFWCIETLHATDDVGWTPDS
jgi:hypothetical protein